MDDPNEPDEPDGSVEPVEPGPPDAPAGSGTPDESEADRYTEHARWILSYHDSRSESFMTRAVALLGFDGVILALLLGSGVPDGVHVDWWIKVPFTVTTAALVGVSYFCLATLKTRELKVPGVDRARENWHDSVTRARHGTAAMDIAETYLGAKNLSQDSAMDYVVGAATERGKSFSRAVGCAGVAPFSLTVLLIVVGVRVA